MISTGGQTSAERDLPWPVHTAQLIEQHTVTAVMDVEQFGSTRAYDIARAQCNEAMADWCTAHGTEALEIQRPPRSDGTVELRWRCIIGKGDIDSNQAVPGVLDNWTWSGRVDFWRYFFSRFDGGREGRRLADIRKGNGRVIQFPSHAPR